MIDKETSVPAYCRIVKATRIFQPKDIPAPDPRTVDVVLLDMNHNWPNMGHDSLVAAVDRSVEELEPALERMRISVRILSYDVRRCLMVPRPQGDRFSLYLGTGGPGHLDPQLNDGVSEGAQGILENAAWEKPLFRLLDAILQSQDAALLAVCHTFGVICRWAGVATAVLRGPEKGGKSSGVLENILTEDAVRHPWFSRLSARLPDGRRLNILDSRLFDLIPTSEKFPAGVVPLAYETLYPGGPRGDALTMLELAADPARTMPRILAVNHHPEIMGREGQKRLLDQKLHRGEVSQDWYEERARGIGQVFSSARSEHLVRLTARFTLLDPLRFHLYRVVRLRAEALGFRADFHESRILDE